ncbi:hypothetical protein [Achromobacter xylosoxidans]|uniref:Uncharacterized protein n=1 Tax=Alcaligenes xylosoxydans xylosoxydans TaxID=85698 RepID=A0A1R1JUI5_ALCXX|nr:hypothetical protein [Achromobacter xylosoxidans]OMG88015.1 hypothetical protein BIZ92_10485 [Achromobacter xylosoxidans]
MKTFIDTATGSPWQFAESDDIRLIDGIYRFFDVNGNLLMSVPETLVPGEAPQPVDPSPVPVTVFSSLDYLQKFSTEEYAAARHHDNVAVQFGLDMLIAAQYVDLEDPRVALTLNLLVDEGVVTSARRDELLAPTVG